MTATLSQTAQLAGTGSFRAQVQAALTTAALDIATEAVNNGGQTPGAYALRHVLAVSVLQNPEQWVLQFAWAVACNATVEADNLNPPDADVQNAVNAAFSDIAGVGANT